MVNRKFGGSIAKIDLQKNAKSQQVTSIEKNLISNLEEKLFCHKVNCIMIKEFKLYYDQRF